MFKSKIFLVSVLAFIVIGCGAGNQLRVDDFIFGSTMAGSDTEVPVFKVGKKVFLNFAVRGMKADDSGQAKITSSVTLTGLEPPVFSATDYQFKVNSEITSFGPPKPITIEFKEKHIGKGTLELTVHDKVSDKKLTKEVPYEVTP